MDSEATMEVDCDVNSDGGHSMDEQDEQSTEDKIFFGGPCTDCEKDDETVRTIRWSRRLELVTGFKIAL